MPSLKPAILLLITVFTLSIHPASARRQYIFEPDTAMVFPHPVSYDSIKVIDDRSNTGKKTDPALVASLTHFGMQLAGNNTRAPHTLLVVVKDQMIDPVTTDKVCTVHLAAEYYLGNAGTYKYLYTADTFYEVYHDANLGLFDDPRKDAWPKLINKAWYKYFEKASLMRLDEATGADYSEIQAINRVAQIKNSQPIYQAEKYTKGIYFTRAEFLNNKPGLTAFIETDNPDGDAYPHAYYKVNERGKKGEHIDSFYVVFNGVRWYKPGRGGLFQLHPENGDFYYTGPMTGLRGLARNNGGVAGLIGLGVGAIITDIINETRVNDPQHAEVKYYIRLDAETGRRMPVKRIGSPQ